jgi:ADP-dependent glucokinase
VIDIFYLNTYILQVLPGVTSLGLNEQELSFSAHVADGPHFDDFHTRTGQPEIHKISDMILWILKTYGYSKENPSSRLTRVHFHSLTYHIVGTLPSAWHNTQSAVAAGTRMAGRQACDVNKLSPPDIELRIPGTFKLFSGQDDYTFDENNPVFSWEREGFYFVFSPVLVCISPLKTVGLGDAISATGLMYSDFDISYRNS